ncbi:hypothetical protein KHS38_18410 [Mucilaginibacter sp. Bleaf8]|uniref:hypothetical protein n=1 Tax=Mucilaginibacter sp. Bleaf8 TaxID=2834430 RepID=UPI001BCB8F06|nr:hypothetical protein [Mucilaginibacter sp. Bleaf8]MBS7566388.1 hypothetical protein [Mucilaginibacter sp. Bleaf8]
MIKNIFTPKRFFLGRWIAPVLILLCSAFVIPVKPVNTIILQDERLTVNPQEFYIQQVTDERGPGRAVANLITDATTAQKQAVDLEGGTAVAIRKFISHNLPANTALRPVVVRINELKITETALPGGRIEGKVSINLAFDRKLGDDYIYLLSYKGSARYIRPDKQQDVIEATLRRTLVNGLVYLNTWMNREADTNPKLAKRVKLTITDYTDNTDPDTIYYSPKRPLTWDDFKARPATGGKYAAEVFPSIAFDEEVAVVNSVIEVRLRMKPYLPKSASWVRNGYRDDYTLNHEQRHFDIVKLAAEHYKRHLLTQQLPITNFDGAIHADYLDAFRDMNNMQQQYDDETQHGINQAAQAQWNERIDKELKSLGVIK